MNHHSKVIAHKNDKILGSVWDHIIDDDISCVPTIGTQKYRQTNIRSDQRNHINI